MRRRGTGNFDRHQTRRRRYDPYVLGKGRCTVVEKIIISKGDIYERKRRPDRTDLEAIRSQILDFACAKHDFKLESEDFPLMETGTAYF